MKGDREHFLEAGKDDYIFKLINVDEVLEVIKKYAVLKVEHVVN